MAHFDRTPCDCTGYLHFHMTPEFRAEIEAAIPRSRALAIIGTHALAPDQPTAVDRHNRVIPESTFDAEMGVQTHYPRAAVYQWLGY